MSVGVVQLPSEVYGTCMAHALSAEHEEVMGLLIGHFEVLSSKQVPLTLKHPSTIIIHSSLVLRRSDKRKDRVEVCHDQLTKATLHAEISFHVCICQHLNIFVTSPFVPEGHSKYFP